MLCKHHTTQHLSPHRGNCRHTSLCFTHFVVFACNIFSHFYYLIFVCFAIDPGKRPDLILKYGIFWCNILLQHESEYIMKIKWIVVVLWTLTENNFIYVWWIVTWREVPGARGLDNFLSLSLSKVKLDADAGRRGQTTRTQHVRRKICCCAFFSSHTDWKTRISLHTKTTQLISYSSCARMCFVFVRVVCDVCDSENNCELTFEAATVWIV